MTSSKLQRTQRRRYPSERYCLCKGDHSRGGTRLISTDSENLKVNKYSNQKRDSQNHDRLKSPDPDSHTNGSQGHEF